VSAGERPDPLAPPPGYGSKPGQQPDYDEPVACCVSNAEKACPRPLGVILWWGDAAEHVFPVGYCDLHGIGTIAQARALRTYCTRCGMDNKIIKIEARSDLVGRSYWYENVQRQLDEIMRQDHG